MLVYEHSAPPLGAQSAADRTRMAPSLEVAGAMTAPRLARTVTRAHPPPPPLNPFLPTETGEPLPWPDRKGHRDEAGGE